MVGVDVEVELTVGITVSVGDEAMSTVTMGAATIVVPPQAVKKKDTTNNKRICCFIRLLNSMMLREIGSRVTNY
jgi:hypothetical protein